MSASDATFGPQLEGQFDFTLLFEQSIFSIVPSAVLLAASPFWIAVLMRRKPSFEASTLLWTKLIAILALFGLQLANLALWSISSSAAHIQVAVAAASLAVANVIAMGSLLYAQHRYSYSPSMLLSVYLSITTLLDVANVRSLFLRGSSDAIGAVTSAALALKLLILALEEVPKRGPTVLGTSKEISSGLWNRSVFWWLNSTFRRGYKTFIQFDDLPRLDHKLDSHHLASRLDREWKSIDKSGKYCLAFATFHAFRASFWTAVIPRLCYGGFSFAQPILIRTIIDFIGSPTPNHAQGVAGTLIGATALVYLGIAFSRCHYMHHTFRLITSVRGGLVALIFAKVVDLEAATAKDSAAVTLMSTDIDGIASGLQKIHDLWASVIELSLGMYLLQRQVGAACFLILVPAVLSSLATARVARGMGPARMLWNAKVQKRVSTTSSTLNQIKGIKMMGLTGRISHLIHSLRVTELDSSKSFRLFFVWINMIANLSDQLTPIIIIAAAVFWTKDGQNLSVAEAFTSLSVVTLVSAPIINIFADYPTFVASLACFKRIQTFLLCAERNDYRSVASSPQGSISKRKMKADDVELQAIQKSNVPRDDGPDEARPVISIKNASFSLHDGHDAVLQNINMTVRKSSLIMIVGPVGSGKSALLKAILGEARILSGSVRLDCGPVAYCDQAAWL
ncbi:ABC transporter C family member 8 [Tolypocladium ophioglossoides CBS 100239]|uniref:ABC transporter C family member 8 n=1 Tax=Tolypocladium ophioglossoides (strain CBS 100239) TaxID=1163406 RepID=A0A0L0MWQ3_TOLOC|nr:ABC transporter C family member 8 [Tolypocladium ophioglossoides CBS 100239]